MPKISVDICRLPKAEYDRSDSPFAVTGDRDVGGSYVAECPLSQADRLLFREWSLRSEATGPASELRDLGRPDATQSKPARTDNKSLQKGIASFVHHPVTRWVAGTCCGLAVATGMLVAAGMPIVAAVVSSFVVVAVPVGLVLLLDQLLKPEDTLLVIKYAGTDGTASSCAGVDVDLSKSLQVRSYYLNGKLMSVVPTCPLRSENSQDTIASDSNFSAEESGTEIILDPEEDASRRISDFRGQLMDRGVPPEAARKLSAVAHEGLWRAVAEMVDESCRERGLTLTSGMESIKFHISQDKEDDQWTLWALIDCPLGIVGDGAMPIFPEDVSLMVSAKIPLDEVDVWEDAVMLLEEDAGKSSIETPSSAARDTLVIAPMQLQTCFNY